MKYWMKLPYFRRVDGELPIEKRKMDIALRDGPRNPDTLRSMRTKISLIKERNQTHLCRNLGDQGGPVRHP